MFRRHRKLALLALALLVAGGAWIVWRSGENGGQAYRTVTVTRGDLKVNVLSTGIVQPRNRLEIKAPIPGRAEQVLVDEGQRVRKGQVLAWMSSTERAALLDAARARGPEELKRWEELYRATPILAPIDGTIILRNVEPGQSFTSNDAVFVMSDYLIVTAQVDETDIAQVRLHQAAHIVLDAYPDTTFDGVVDLIAYDAKTVNNVTTYSVDVLPRKRPAFMRSGMTANVTFDAATRKGALLVPGDAIRVHEGRAYVLRSAPDPKAAPVEQEIQMGISDGKHTEVLAGVSEGETLLVPVAKTGDTSKATNPFMPRRKR